MMTQAFSQRDNGPFFRKRTEGLKICSQVSRATVETDTVRVAGASGDASGTKSEWLRILKHLQPGLQI